jgi:hypothetical protein
VGCEKAGSDGFGPCAGNPEPSVGTATAPSGLAALEAEDGAALVDIALDLAPGSNVELNGSLSVLDRSSPSRSLVDLYTGRSVGASLAAVELIPGSVSPLSDRFADTGGR